MARKPRAGAIKHYPQPPLMQGINEIMFRSGDVLIQAAADDFLEIWPNGNTSIPSAVTLHIPTLKRILSVIEQQVGG